MTPLGHRSNARGTTSGHLLSRRDASLPQANQRPALRGRQGARIRPRARRLRWRGSSLLTARCGSEWPGGPETRFRI
jgi:hypothetical protein